MVIVAGGINCCEKKAATDLATANWTGGEATSRKE